MKRGFLLAVLPVLTLGVVDCYSTGDGTAPPVNQFYFPVGLQVSHGGTVLYAANSDFDLQFNGGTIQSYDLRLIREHAVLAIRNPRDPALPLTRPSDATDNPCPGNPPVTKDDGSGLRQPLGETCAPPVKSEFYFRDSAVIGAFATDLVLSKAPADLVPQQASSIADPPASTRGFDRLFVPVRGNASLTWVSVPRDNPDSNDPGRFRLTCGQDASQRCDGLHQAGTDPNEPGNTRHITMPGEPFGITMSEDGESIVITHQSDTKTSLFSSGLSRTSVDDSTSPPSLAFVLDGVPVGGIGVFPVPHDRDAFAATAPFPRPAFLETLRTTPEVDLLRRYPDANGGIPGVGSDNGSSLRRPFLDRETLFPILPSAGGSDSRGIAIDPTRRIACKAKVAPANPPARTDADVAAEKLRCAQLPARVFIANRSPASLLVGEIGTTSSDGTTYDPDNLQLHTNIPLSAGPSKLYLAPIVDKDGALALRLFAVCFDSATIFIYDPDTFELENVVRVAPGPFAMAFDPFDLTDVATHKIVPLDPREPTDLPIRRYRFAYLASFTQSFVQLLDLDDAQADRSTFERVVFTLGQPTNPKGS